jgi:hypothetical protein
MTSAVSCTRSRGMWLSTSLHPRNTGVPSSEPAYDRGVPGGPMRPPLSPAIAARVARRELERQARPL